MWKLCSGVIDCGQGWRMVSIPKQTSLCKNIMPMLKGCLP